MSSNRTVEDPILVSYHDSIVRSSNLSTLDNSNWLDDNILNFTLEYIQYNSSNQQSTDRILFITPPVVQLLKMSHEIFAQQLLESLNFLDKQFLILPINDNSHVESVGGSHWSLLIVAIPEKQIYHFDSMSPSNSRSAKLIQTKFQSFLNQKREMIEADSPQQMNGFDCGLYVIVNIEEFVEQLSKNVEKDFFKKFIEHIKTRVTPEYIHQRRKQLREQIQTMANQMKA